MKVQTKSGIFLFVLFLFNGQFVDVSPVKGQRKTIKPRAPVVDRKALRSRHDIVPLVDYHVHLLGPYALPLPDPLPPEIKLPSEINRLLVERARLFGSVESEKDFETVFTEDAQLLDAFVAPAHWMRDKHWFMRFLNLWSKASRLRYAPNQYNISGSTGFVAGTVVNEASGQHRYNFLLGIRRTDAGLWRIAVESTTEKTLPRYTQPITADRLIADLDEAGIERAVVLSEAFWLGGPGAKETKRMIDAKDEAAAVRGENDWTAQQVARYPDRLILACAVNPLKDYAIPELERCAKTLKAKAMKLNFGDSGVSFDNPEHMEKVARFFKTADGNRIAIIVHLEPGRFYGPAEVKLFLERIVSAAPNIPIQIAHLAGNGPGITSPEALAAFAEARAAKDSRTQNLYFDFAGLVDKKMTAEEARIMVERMRQIGLDHVLYASDSSPSVAGNLSTDEHWTLVRRKLPLTDAELRTIAGNVAPYLR
jgi:uncharacterized protein